MVLAHSERQLASVYLERVNEEDNEWIEVMATVVIRNPDASNELADLASALPPGYALPPETIQKTVFHTFQGVAKSAAEGSPAWEELKKKKPSSPEVSNPTEMAATSALGRALGNAGLGQAETFGFPSAEEMQVATDRQAAANMPTPPPTDPNAPTAAAKKALYNLAVEKLPDVTTPESFDKYVKRVAGKPAKVLTAAEVRSMTSELRALDAPNVEDVGSDPVEAGDGIEDTTPNF